jgi:hypothetical protein
MNKFFGAVIIMLLGIGNQNSANAQQSIFIRANNGKFLGVSPTEGWYKTGNARYQIFLPKWSLRALDPNDVNDYKLFAVKPFYDSIAKVNSIGLMWNSQYMSITRTKYYNDSTKLQTDYAALVANKSTPPIGDGLTLQRFENNKYAFVFSTSVGLIYLQLLDNGNESYVILNPTKNPTNDCLFDIINSNGTAFEPDLTSSLEAYQPNAVIRVPALGISREKSLSMLGKVFDENFQEIGYSCQSKPLLGKLNEYKATFSAIEDEFQLKANASILGLANASSEKLKNSKYGFFRASSISESAEINCGNNVIGNPNAKLLATRILFGWSVYILTSGNDELMTQEMSASLKKVSVNGGRTIRNSNVFENVVSYGLQSKYDNSCDMPLNKEEIENMLRPAKPAQPIFIEYRVLNPFETPKIRWKKFAGAQYKIEKIQFSIGKKKNSLTGAWDFTKPTPDVRVTVLLDNQRLGRTSSKDGFFGTLEQSECVTLQNLKILPSSRVELHVWDEDANQDDPIGVAYFTYDDLYKAVTNSESGFLSQEVDIKLSVSQGGNQLNGLVVTLTPLK